MPSFEFTLARPSIWNMDLLFVDILDSGSIIYGNPGTLDISIEKISKYVKFVTKINFRDMNLEEDYNIQGKFKKCEAKDFTDRNLIITDEM